jgi:hypothetical protein
MSLPRWYGVPLALLVAGVLFAAGRYTAPLPPPRVEVREKVMEHKVEVEHKVEGPVRVVTRTVERLAACPALPGQPAASEPVRETTVVEERGEVVIERTGATEASREREQVVTPASREPARWMVGASYGLALGSAPTPGALVAYRLAGPVWLGASGDLGGNLRASVAVTF